MFSKITKNAVLTGTATLLVGITACAQEDAAPVEDLAVDAQGAIHFATHEDFYATIDAVGRMSPAEFDSWEKRHGFVSYRHEFEHVMQQVVNAPTPQAADEILLANDDIVDVTADGAEPRIQPLGYTEIANRSGIFYVEGVIHKVTPDAVIAAEDGRRETIDATLASLDKHGAAVLGTKTPSPAGVRIMPYRNTSEDQQQVVLTNSGCTNEKTAWFNTSDRKVDFYVQTFDYPCSGCCGNFYHQVRVDGNLKGYREQTFGSGWTQNSYNTSYNYDNLEFQIMAPQVSGFGVGPNGQAVSLFSYQPYTMSGLSGASNGDWQTWGIGSWDIGHQVQNSEIAIPYFDKVKGRGKSRGTGENGWAEICCGYAGGCSFPPSCTPRTSCYTGECGYVSDNCGGTLYCGACGGGGGGGGTSCVAPTTNPESNLIQPICATE